MQSNFCYKEFILEFQNLAHTNIHLHQKKDQ